MTKEQKRLVLILLLAIVFTSFLKVNRASSSSSSQITDNANLVWEKTFGGTGDDRAFYAITAGDGFLVVGSSKSFEHGKTVAWVLRLDHEGNALWNRTYPEGVGSEFRYTISLPDGFLLVGNEFSSDTDPNGFVAKIDNEGAMLWNITVGGEMVDRLFSAVKTEDGFVLVGLTESFGSNDNFNVWLVKIDANGSVVWNKTFGWSMDDAGRAIALSKDNSYIIAGYTNSTGNGDYDFLVLKVDAAGNLVWNRTYGGSESDKAYAIAPAADGYVIAGDTRSKGAGDSDAWVIKIDLQGNLLWEKTVGGNGFDAPTCISPSTEGGYLVGGTTFSFGNGQRDFWLFKIDDSGNVLWSCTVGRSMFEESYAVREVSENEFMMAGWTNSVGNGFYDFYVVKIKVENTGNWWGTNQFIIFAVVSVALVLMSLFFFRYRFNRRKKESEMNIALKSDVYWAGF